MQLISCDLKIPKYKLTTDAVSEAAVAPGLVQICGEKITNFLITKLKVLQT